MTKVKKKTLGLKGLLKKIGMHMSIKESIIFSRKTQKQMVLKLFL